MKTLINSPVAWAERGVGSRMAFVTLVSIHIMVGFLAVLYLNAPVTLVLFTTVFPLYYLYALKKLVDELKALNERTPGKSQT